MTLNHDNLSLHLFIYLQSRIWIIHRVHDELNIVIIIIISSFNFLFFLLCISHLVVVFLLRFEIRNKDYQLRKNKKTLFFYLFNLFDSSFFIFSSNNFFCMHLVSLYSLNFHHVIVLFRRFIFVSFCYFFAIVCSASFFVNSLTFAALNLLRNVIFCSKSSKRRFW